MRSCRCRCHSVPQAELGQARQRENDDAIKYWLHDLKLFAAPKVDARDLLECLVSLGCTCAGYHALIPIHVRPPKYLPPNRWEPEEGDCD